MYTTLETNAVAFIVCKKEIESVDSSLTPEKYLSMTEGSDFYLFILIVKKWLSYLLWLFATQLLHGGVVVLLALGEEHLQHPSLVLKEGIR
jgi:hypothetical protein